MKIISPTLVLLSIFLIFLIHCSSNVAGGPGTGSETTNGIVLSATGNPVAHASVLLIDEKNWLEHSASNTSSTIDSVVTNSKGRFEFTTPLPSTFTLQIIGVEEGLVIKNAETLLNAD